MAGRSSSRITRSRSRGVESCSSKGGHRCEEIMLQSNRRRRLQPELVQEGVLPLPGTRPGAQLRNPLPVPDLSESQGQMQAAAGRVVGENARLDRPVAV